WHPANGRSTGPMSLLTKEMKRHDATRRLHRPIRQRVPAVPPPVVLRVRHGGAGDRLRAPDGRDRGPRLGRVQTAGSPHRAGSSQHADPVHDPEGRDQTSRRRLRPRHPAHLPRASADRAALPDRGRRDPVQRCDRQRRPSGHPRRGDRGLDDPPPGHGVHGDQERPAGACQHPERPQDHREAPTRRKVLVQHGGVLPRGSRPWFRDRHHAARLHRPHPASVLLARGGASPRYGRFDSLGQRPAGGRRRRREGRLRTHWTANLRLQVLPLQDDLRALHALQGGRRVNWKTKIWVEMLLWIALTIAYWTVLYLSPTRYSTLSPECLFGYVIVAVATAKVTNRWKKL